MAYDQTVPATGHSGSQDYNAIRGNFAQLQSTFSVDHEPIASGGGIDGFHKQVHLVSGSDPAKVAGVGIAYTKVSSGHSELFYEGEVITGSIVQVTNQGLTAASGQGMVPGGLQIRAGSTTMTGQNQHVSYTAFPNAIISVVATSAGGSNQAYITLGTITNGGFNLFQTGGTFNFDVKWVVVGY